MRGCELNSVRVYGLLRDGGDNDAHRRLAVLTNVWLVQHKACAYKVGFGQSPFLNEGSVIHPYIAKLWTQAWSMIVVGMNAAEISNLFRAKEHSTRLIAQRASIIVARVRLFAGVFAVLTPLWILIDVWVFDPQIWRGLLPIRLLTAAAFAAILAAVRNMHTQRDAYRALLFLFIVPAAFFISAYLFISRLDHDGVPDGFAIGYAYVPLIMMAGLSLFPLTVLEGGAFALLVFGVQLITAVSSPHVIEWPGFVAYAGVLALVAAISVLVGISQLSFMIVNVREAIHDALTGCFSRRCGEELLELQFTWCVRGNRALAVALIDLDNFRDVNEIAGYAAGDAVLKKVCQTLYDSMRSGDMLIRWTGDRFLIVMPHASIDQARTAVQRLSSSGLGVRPDGTAVTASIGLAERGQDVLEDWWSLIDTATARAQAGRNAGGNRSVTE